MLLNSLDDFSGGAGIDASTAVSTGVAEAGGAGSAPLVNLEGIAVQNSCLPVDLPRLMCSLEAEGVLRLLGRQTQSSTPWIPVTTLGPLIVMAHSNPQTDGLWGIPEFLCVRIVISQEQYQSLSTDFMKRVANKPLAEYNPVGEIPSPNLSAGQLPQAFEWLTLNYPFPPEQVEFLKRTQDEQIKKDGGELDVSGYNKIKPHYGVALAYICDCKNTLVFNPDDTKTQNFFPNHLLEKYVVYPAYVGRQKVYMMGETIDHYSFEDEYLSSGHDPIEIVPVLADAKVIKKAISRSSSQLQSHTVEVDISKDEISVSALENVIEIHPEDVQGIDPSNVNHSVEEILHWVLFFSITSGASDLHLEKYYNTCRFRGRFDGKLRVIYSTMEDQLPKFIALIKNAGKMGQSRQEAQDGRMSILIRTRQVDVRIAAVPTRGEFQKIIMRFLDKQEGLKKLADLNLAKRHSDIINRCMNRDQGLILVTGPTGSGKTTTLYALLQHVNSDDINIQTIEDPIEYEIEGINQTQVDKSFGLDFANGLRALMRADPDVILIGETRDEETAAAAVNASLTGHLVLTTLHANDSLRAVSRLLSMGVESYLLADSVALTQAQRLIRRLCNYCKRPMDLTQEIQEHFYNQGVITEPITEPIFEGTGCENCRDTGYAGRLALMELCEVNTEIGDLIEKNAPQSEMRAIANRNGVLSLYQEGLIQVMKGLTTMKEISKLSYTAI